MNQCIDCDNFKPVGNQTHKGKCLAHPPVWIPQKVGVGKWEQPTTEAEWGCASGFRPKEVNDEDSKNAG